MTVDPHIEAKIRSALAHIDRDGEAVCAKCGHTETLGDGEDAIDVFERFMDHVDGHIKAGEAPP